MQKFRDYKKLNKLIKSSKNIFIMAHNNLDLDAIGSSIGMYNILNSLKKKCFLIIDEKEHELGVKKVLQELEGCLNIITSKDVEQYMNKKLKKNLLLILDTNKKDLIQSSTVLELFTKTVILDHHETGKKTIEATLSIINNDYSSTCEMIEELVEYYDMEIDSYLATVLLSGIVLDTNNFTLKTNSNTFYAAYYLTSMGASPKKVQYLLKQNLEDYIEREKLLTNTQIIGNVALTKGTPYTIYRREDLAKIADTLLYFNNVEASFVIGKIDKDTVGVSARSMGNINISNILEKLGGGGDKYNGAAVFEKKPISKVEEVIRQILINR